MNALTELGIARCGGVLLPCIAMTLGVGCGAEVYSSGAYPVGGDAVVSVDVAPFNIESYPHYYYDGGYAYNVDGRWYRQGPRGWGYYRQEPRELARQRANIQERSVSQAPAVSRQARGIVEAQPPNGKVTTRARAATKGTAPPRDRQR